MFMLKTFESNVIELHKHASDDADQHRDDVSVKL